jgi:hypothetical protein
MEFSRRRLRCLDSRCCPWRSLWTNSCRTVWWRRRVYNPSIQNLRRYTPRLRPCRSGLTLEGNCDVPRRGATKSLISRKFSSRGSPPEGTEHDQFRRYTYLLLPRGGSNERKISSREEKLERFGYLARYTWLYTFARELF